jgi:ADP-ribose pyrophosphatase YjhB (NUDIX family)
LPDSRFISVRVAAADLTGTGMLMVRRSEASPQAGLWKLIGGLVERRETLRQAAEREWQEETGSRLAQLGTVYGAWEFELEAGPVVGLAMLGLEITGVPKLNAGTDKIDRLAAFTLSEVRQLPLIGYERETIISGAERLCSAGMIRP